MFSPHQSLCAILFLFACSSAGFSQTTWYVPDDSPTIQPAFNSSLVVDGDTVIVRPGTYVEMLNFRGKAITLISEMGPEVTVIKGNNWGGTVKMQTNEGNDSVIEGFTITHDSAFEGPGIYLDHASPTVRNCQIINNQDYYNTGGINCYYSSPVITDCLFQGNKSDWYEGRGGALETYRGHPIVTHCTFQGNSAERSGGLYLNQSNAIFTSCTFKQNRASVLGGAVGTYLCQDLTFNDCSFISNRAQGGPGFSCYGGAIHNSGSTIRLMDCTFRGNTADQGGGITGGGSLELINSVFSGNSAEEGGGIRNYGSTSVVMTNCTFHGNVGTTLGGGMYNPAGCMPEVKNSIFWGNWPDAIYNGSGAPQGTFSYCDMEGGYPGTANIDQDPQFVDSENNDFHLTELSPCINRGTAAGAPDHDQDQESRPFMGSVDMGVDEFTGPHPFQADGFIVPVAGGVVNLTLDAGATQAGRTYLILGSKNGTAPGIPLPGGLVTLPVNWDSFTDYVLNRLNSSLFSNFLGVLDPAGQGTAQLNIPPIGPSHIGSLLQFAYTLEGSPDWDFVSNPLGIAITP